MSSSVYVGKFDFDFEFEDVGFLDKGVFDGVEGSDNEAKRTARASSEGSASTGAVDGADGRASSGVDSLADRVGVCDASLGESSC